MDADAFLESVRSDPAYSGQIVHVHRVPPRDPQWAEPPEGLRPEIRRFLSALGVSSLYRHQAEAIEGVLAERLLATIERSAP